MLFAPLFAASLAISAALSGGFEAPHQEPTVWADIPDIAICRKGPKYYMVSTTMHYNPGIPVMVSTDLVDWKIASYCYETAEDRPKDRLENGENDYGVGTYASSIRYNEADGYFYVISLNPAIDVTYLFRTRDPESEPWTFARLPKAQYDASIFFDEGRVYVYASQGSPEGFKVRLTEMKSDLSGFVDGGEIVIPKVNDCIEKAGLGEGTQVFKRNGWYYVVNISWGEKGRAAVMHRSRTRKGPWEGRVIFQFQGIAQGSLGAIRRGWTKAPSPTRWTARAGRRSGTRFRSSTPRLISRAIGSASSCIRRKRRADSPILTVSPSNEMARF